MAHQTRRGAPLECPLASLGRNSPSLEPQPYHHPLSTSPLNPQAYQMSRKSPLLTIKNDNIIYTSTTTRQKPAAVDHSHCSVGYQLSRNSSSSRDESFEMHRNLGCASQFRHLPARNYTPIDSLLQYRKDRTPIAYLMSDSSVTKFANNDENCATSAVMNQNDQYFLEEKMDSLYIQGLPLDSETNQRKNDRFFLQENLNELSEYKRNGAMRGEYYKNESSDKLNNVNFSSENIMPHLLQIPSSPSETSGSDRYVMDRARRSPAFVNATRNNFSNTNAVTMDKRYQLSKVQCFTEDLSNLGRFSPNMDQGYATLVSPSPTSHQQSTGPWNQKGPYRSGPVFDRLSDEDIIHIFNWLDSSDLCHTARVCRRFEAIAWNPRLWKIINLDGEHICGDKALKNIFRRLCGQSRNGACPDIERVLLSNGCRISDKGLQLLARRCPELTHLQIQLSINVSNQALCGVLTKCSNLQHLDVTGCIQITNIGIDSNLEPPRRLLLQFLDLTDCTAIDDTGLKLIVCNCPQIVFLYLRRCIQITDAGLKFVPSFCIALKELSVSDCVNITDFGLYELAKLGAALRYLSVAKCDRVSDAGLKVIARRCYKLRYLNARGCEAVSDDSITVLARSCPRLRALDIGKCDVSDAGLRALAESCPNLKKLSLRNCDMITDRGVQCIAYYCRGLQQLNIQDCQISVEGYRAVKKYCKRCVIEHTNPGFC